MRSIQTRLATGLLLSLVVLLLAQWLIVARSIVQLSEQYIASRIVHTSDLLIAAINFDQSGKPLLDDSRIDPVFSKPFSGYYYTISINDQVYRSRSLWDESLPTLAPGVGSSETARSQGPQGQQLLVVATTYSKQQSTIQVTVAEDITGISHDIRSLLTMHAIVSGAILVILISLQVLIVRRSLLPLDKARKDLDKLEKGIIQCLDENVPSEIIALVHEINLRVAAFQQRLERSRRASGNLAHALKTPLTLLRHLSETPELEGKTEIKQALQKYTTDIKQIIDRELQRARLSGTAVGATQTELNSEVNALIKSLQAMYHEKALDIQLLTPHQCAASMDREDFHEMLGNILDNACKWATEKVYVSFTCKDDLIITVEDDGTGIPAEQRQIILNRGTRLDEQTAGHGLGLSIVKDIIDQYKGSMIMTNSETLGGLKTIITIPLQSHEDKTKT